MSPVHPPLDRDGVDRDHLRRTVPGLLDTLRTDPSARVLLLRDGRAPVTAAADQARLVLPPAPAISGGGLVVYLGRSTIASGTDPLGTPYLLVVDDGTVSAPDLDEGDHLWLSLRDAALRLGDPDAALLTEAVGLANWHASHGYSPRTGKPTHVEDAGWVRRPADGGEVFPRTDPAVIVCVLDADDRLLLGSNALWEANRFSLLAGFVEPGESLEAAVRREVREECGLSVIDPVYVASQPWPFPASLMVGFTARLAPGEDPSSLVADGEEIVALRWFTRKQLAAAGDEVLLPARSSIARTMIEGWFGGPLDD